MGKPLIWSPRGALQATAQWKDVANLRAKRVFEYIFRLARPSKMILHVTAEIERELSLTRVPNLKAAIIPNSVEVPKITGTRKNWKKNGMVRLMFISRIHRKKGIEYLIDALSHLPVHFNLDVYGDGDPEYIFCVKARVSSLGLANRVRFHGHVEGEQKSDAFRNADIFVLPTHSENFGNVIAEALAFGVPTITTKNAPWAEIEERRVGLWIDNTVSEIAQAILRVSEMDLMSMGSRGRQWMQEKYSPEVVGLAFAKLYKDILSYDKVS
jgi:glycosyltransferase involved in cell wall biosynthesis